LHDGTWLTPASEPGVEPALHADAEQVEVARDQVGTADEVALHLVAGPAGQKGALRFAARLAQDPLADLDCQPVLLGERNELVGRNEASRRVAPAQLSFEADDLAIHPRPRLAFPRSLAFLNRRLRRLALHGR
jgi:hypothetical protein